MINRESAYFENGDADGIFGSVSRSNALAGLSKDQAQALVIVILGKSFPQQHACLSFFPGPPPSNLGSAVASSMHLTNTSEPMSDASSSHYNKILESSHDSLYYQVNKFKFISNLLSIV